jgi:hypothetical protein
VEEQGFSGHLNPIAWVRALHCNSVYICTALSSMKVPISVCTSYSKPDFDVLWIVEPQTTSYTHNFYNEWDWG